MGRMMSCYDDAEGTLRDQGLEVVVIPYRPSPPPPKRKSVSKDNENKSAMAGTLGRIPPRPTANDGPPLAAPPTTRPQAAAVVPRRSLTDVDDNDDRRRGSSVDTESDGICGGIVDGAMKKSHGRGRSVAIADRNDHRRSRSTAQATPPRFRSKSSPTASSSSKKRGGRNSREGGGHHQMGIYQMAKLGYQELCNAIIRPPRSDYPLEALGPEEFDFCGERFVRRDFGVVNERGLLLECSMWRKKIRHEEEGEEEEGECKWQRQDQDDDDDDGGSNDEHDHRCGQITLNVDDWDESKERGQMYLQVPESFEESSTASSAWNEDEEEDGDDDDESRDSFDREPPGRVMHPCDRGRGSTLHVPYRGGFARRKKYCRTPVVIYLHGNSSGRPEVVNTLGHLLSLGVAVVAFDFAGSGKSEGEFVSLGYYEQEDLQTVIHHLRASGEVSTIALWGRSMGAATAIMYGSRDATVSCMILDSAFTDLTRLAEEMVEKVKEQGINVPNFVVSMTLRMIKSSIKSQAGFSIKHISPISHVSRCLIPAMFVAGEHDSFINKQHSECLHNRYAGDKNLVIVDGDHNSPRPRYLLQSACLFLQSCMQLSPSLELVVPMGTNLFLPPWFREGEGCPRGEADRIKTLAMLRARAEVSSSSDRRAWLPVNDSGGGEQTLLQQQRSHPSSQDCNLQNEILLEKGQLRARSCTSALRNEFISSHTAADFRASLELPDMSQRQKDIQSSLFKMLGQHE
ncbi:hypothetical protein ACHAXA_006856 [Cyclostephanos tholiformis]|uniref:Serine aminopeptidase S33 domain-containing protein n=1 Tax=Cyclostephanos tholiformis TaxID=382380 RepID=A0ABD3RLW2_9STRA